VASFNPTKGGKGKVRTISRGKRRGVTTCNREKKGPSHKAGVASKKYKGPKSLSPRGKREGRKIEEGGRGQGLERRKDWNDLSEKKIFPKKKTIRLRRKRKKSPSQPAAILSNDASEGRGRGIFIHKHKRSEYRVGCEGKMGKKDIVASRSPAKKEV